LGAVYTIIFLSILVFIHELGHFLAAVFCKVKVETFSIGFGPKIFKLVHNETVYALSLIPLGGYVKMLGENPTKTLENNDNSFFSKKWDKKILIAFAGPFFNLIFAFILISFTFVLGRTYQDFHPIIGSVNDEYSSDFNINDTILKVNDKTIKCYSDIFSHIKENQLNNFLIENEFGEYQKEIMINSITDFYKSINPKTSNIVGDVSPGLPAWKAGIKQGDRIISIDDEEVDTWYDIRNIITKTANTSLKIRIVRDSTVYDVLVHPEINPLDAENYKIIGIMQHLDLEINEQYSLIEAVKLGSISTFSYIYFNYSTLFQLAKNPSSLRQNVGGPVMVYYLTKETTKRGFVESLLFIAVLSIMLGFMNLLPIPVLDGGQILFHIYEGIFKKSLAINMQILLQQIGFMLLIFLMFFAFYSDISKVVAKNDKNMTEVAP
jgi:regulator of sigma E protease